MPRKVTKWLCGFKCGHSALNERQSMEKHEEYCWKNPATRSCTTCNKGKMENDYDGFTKWDWWECSIKDGQKLQEDTREYRDKEGRREQPVFMCPFWEGDSGQHYDPKRHLKWLETIKDRWWRRQDEEYKQTAPHPVKGYLLAKDEDLPF